MNTRNLAALDNRAIDNILMIKSSSGDLLPKLIGLYRQESPELISKIAEGIKNADVGQVLASAHSLKSTSATLGASKLAEYAKEIELLARNSEVTGGWPVLKNIESEHLLVLSDLEKLLAEY